MEKLVSIVIPVYQVKKYLRKCIESILDQVFDDIEIILVDDGSTDGSGELCDEYAERDQRITVIHKENGGLSSARNAGIELATGEYIAFVDSDDWVSKDFISLMLKTCMSMDCDICQCGFFDAIGYEDDIEDIGGEPLLFSSYEFAYSEISLLSWECVVCWNKLFKRSLFKGITFPEGKIHEDEYTTYKLVDRAKRIAVIPTRLYYYRHHQDSIVGKRYSYKRLDAGEAYKKRADFYHNEGEYDLELAVKARYLQWIDGAVKQFTNIDNRNKDTENRIFEEKRILSKELDGKIIIRRDFRKNKYIFPFDRVEKGSNIIIYGAGMVGKQYFLQVKAINYCNIKLWVDRKYLELRKIGIPVQDVNKIQGEIIGIDAIVIALVDGEVAGKVIAMLENTYGVKRDKIVHSINSVMDISPEDNQVGNRSN